ncbi:MAG: metallophosphoesterase [Bacilli bacterium]
MKKRLFCFSLVSLLLLSSCNQSRSYPLADYKKTMPFHVGFKILQLTDLHYSLSTDLNQTNAVVKSEIEASNPDLIVLTGDSFMDANKAIVNYTFSFLDSFNIPFAFTYGNHDLQGTYDTNFIHYALGQTKNALFVDYDDDDLYGRSNYFIDLVEGNNTKYRLYILDSNSYWKAKSFVGYDVFHEEQIKHVENIAATYGTVPSLAFFHLPLYEFKVAYQEYQEGLIAGNGVNNEKCSVCYTSSDAFSRFKASGIEGMFIGHKHTNYSTLDYQNVFLSYGVKSTSEIYHKRIGYSFITLNSEHLQSNDIEKVFINE